jgi:hypothetical protein
MHNNRFDRCPKDYNTNYPCFKNSRAEAEMHLNCGLLPRVRDDKEAIYLYKSIQITQIRYPPSTVSVIAHP